MLFLRSTPLGFDWPLYKKWWGYKACVVECKTCNGKGEVNYLESTECPSCVGDKVCYFDVAIPEGEGFQLWAGYDISAHPVSPSFSNLMDLSTWMAEHHGGFSVLGWYKNLTFGSISKQKLLNKNVKIVGVTV